MENNPQKLKDFYVTSDTWFGREHVLQISKQRHQFSDISEMNKHIIKLWNKINTPQEPTYTSIRSIV